MNYKLCYLYGIKSTKKLCELLGIENPSSFSIKKTPLSVKPKIDYMKSPKGRLVEAPSKELKTIQRRLLKKLQKLDIPSYAFCGVKGKTVVDNASMHEGRKYIYQTDLSKFFPHVTRDKVYRFFINKMKFSPDAARLITDICTIDYKYVDKVKHEEVFQYMQRVGVKPSAHIMTGSPASCILSYLVNEDMFNVLNSKCEKQGITMTIYIDDITFSCFSK